MTETDGHNILPSLTSSFPLQALFPRGSPCHCFTVCVTDSFLWVFSHHSIITTFAVVSSVSGASLSIGLLLLLGLATVFADALSMYASERLFVAVGAL